MLRPVTALVLLTTLAVPLLQHHHGHHQDATAPGHAPAARPHPSAQFEHPLLRPAPVPAPTAPERTGPSTGLLGPGDVVVPVPPASPAPRAVVRPL